MYLKQHCLWVFVFVSSKGGMAGPDERTHTIGPSELQYSTDVVDEDGLSLLATEQDTSAVCWLTCMGKNLC